jgi:chromosome segregation ATPase
VTNQAVQDLVELWRTSEAVAAGVVRSRDGHAAEIEELRYRMEQLEADKSEAEKAVAELARTRDDLKAQNKKVEVRGAWGKTEDGHGVGDVEKQLKKGNGPRAGDQRCLQQGGR